MKTSMFRPIEKFKVFNSIVGFNTVDMVDYFGRFKIPSKIFLHNKTGTGNIFINFSKLRVVRRPYSYISIFIFNYVKRQLIFFLTYIKTLFRTMSFILRRKRIKFYITNITSFFNFSTSPIMSIFSSGHHFTTTQSGTESLVRFTRECFNFFSTNKAFFNNHITSKIKAAFGGLKETVKFPHLRRLGLFKKNLFPLSSLSITNFGGLSI